MQIKIKCERYCETSATFQRRFTYFMSAGFSLKVPKLGLGPLKWVKRYANHELKKDPTEQEPNIHLHICELNHDHKL